MRIHKEGYNILIIFFLFLVGFNILADILLGQYLLFKWIFLILTSLLYCFLLFFFRVPDRSLEPKEGVVYSPADGKIVVIEETEEKEYYKDNCLQVSIFMSPFNMHSNRYPVSGIVKYVNYKPGRNIVAWHPKSSELNEMATVVLETSDRKKIIVRQVAGAFARRIVTYAKEGNEVIQGDELGFIKFGSRVDIFLPLDAKVEVSILQHVKANKSIIARL
ncbi:MAG TPA: phosphatidylserine decarboxylase family protein [Bacteroidales bacterium]|nr:phosphatidylserine decarboxylase family protein [Bacteroidales bacterium]HQG36468.1 phosphatidylserine decarboxylase family protein [Bacteroidales bacterium]HQG52547.1 phosphatidylserine decarboxylase family protein [Bacteroidales bacterium]HQJ21448.1 phosphatidylserine decarboxylase family protein [Bacteroidales bacterium]